MSTRYPGPPFSAEEVARIIAVDTRTVLDALRGGRLAGTKVELARGGERWEVDRDDVYRWLRLNKMTDRDARNLLLPAGGAVVVAGDPPDWDYRRADWHCVRVDGLFDLGLLLARGLPWAIAFDLDRLGPKAATRAAWQLGGELVRPHRLALAGAEVPPVAADVFDVIVPRAGGSTRALAALAELWEWERADDGKGKLHRQASRKKSGLTPAAAAGQTVPSH